MKRQFVTGTLIAAMVLATGCGSGTKAVTEEGDVTTTQAAPEEASVQEVNLDEEEEFTPISLSEIKLGVTVDDVHAAYYKEGYSAKYFRPQRGKCNANEVKMIYDLGDQKVVYLFTDAPNTYDKDNPNISGSEVLYKIRTY